MQQILPRGNYVRRIDLISRTVNPPATAVDALGSVRHKKNSRSSAQLWFYVEPPGHLSAPFQFAPESVTTDHPDDGDVWDADHEKERDRENPISGEYKCEYRDEYNLHRDRLTLRPFEKADGHLDLAFTLSAFRSTRAIVNSCYLSRTRTFWIGAYSRTSPSRDC